MFQVFKTIWYYDYSPLWLVSWELMKKYRKRYIKNHSHFVNAMYSYVIWLQKTKLQKY